MPYFSLIDRHSHGTPLSLFHTNYIYLKQNKNATTPGSQPYDSSDPTAEVLPSESNIPWLNIQNPKSHFPQGYKISLENEDILHL